MSNGVWFASESAGSGLWALSESTSSAATIHTATADPTGGTTADIGCTTDTASGDLFALVRIGGSPAADTAIEAGGQSAAVSTTTPSIAYTGLTAATGYSVDIVQKVSGVYSNVLTTTFTTDNTGGGGGSLALDVGLAAETDTAYALALTKILTAGLASETDTALGPVLSNLGGGITVGAAEETDTALPLALRKILAAGVASETDSAQAVALRRALATGLAAESDSALSLALRKLLTTGRADEVDTALDMTLGSFSIGIAAETDTAFALDLISIQPAGPSEGGGGRPSWAKPLKGKRSAEGAMLARLLEEDKMLLGMVRDLYDSGAFEPLAEV